MKINLPVTNVETLLPEGEFIYSSTDLKGVIVEANEAFAEVSNYTREEMIGQSHNLVRHPDMPPEAFADLWEDLKAGRPWRGIVKNRRKDGAFTGWLPTSPPYAKTARSSAISRSAHAHLVKKSPVPKLPTSESRMAAPRSRFATAASSIIVRNGSPAYCLYDRR